MSSTIALYLYTNRQERGQGRYKLGETRVKEGDDIEKAVLKRVNSQKTASSSKLEVVRYWETDVAKGKYDDAVRGELKAKGYRLIEEGGGTEWVESPDEGGELSGEDALIQDINDIILGKQAVDTYAPREEQEACKEQIVGYFSDPDEEGTYENKRRFLIDAKPRFGKTFTALNAVKDLNYKNILMLTWTPEASKEWIRQIDRHINFANWKHMQAIDSSSGKPILPPDSEETTILFASAQDMLDYKNKDKWSKVRDFPWDLIIFDEFDYGGLTENSRDLLASIKSTSMLALTGTALYLQTRRYFKPNAIFTWDYEMEQAKKEEEKQQSPSKEEYKWLPRMNFVQPNLGKDAFDISAYYDEEERFSFNKFFAVDQEGEFLNEYDVVAWLKGVFGLREPTASPYRQFNLKHSLWLLPNVKHCKAMLSLLRKESGKSIPEIEVRDISGDGEHSRDSKREIDNAVKNKDGLMSITLSVRKYTRGTSVPEWDSVFMLNNIEQAAPYIQSSFRCQTQWPAGEKTDCYVIDYDPNRLLRTMRERTLIMNDYQRDKAKQSLREFFDSAPIWSAQDNKWSVMDFSEIWEMTKEATSFNRTFNSGFMSNMIYAINLDKQSIELFSDLAKTISAKKFSNLSNADADVIIEFNQEQAELKNNRNETRPQESDSESKKDTEAEKTIKDLTQICADIIVSAVKCAVVSEEREVTLEDFYTSVDPDAFENATGISVEQFKGLMENEIIDPDAFTDVLISLNELEDEL